MPNSKMFRPVQVGTKKRYTYARSQEVLGMPHLLDLQTKSYEWFCKEAEGCICGYFSYRG